jgi:hypothetical protein
MMTTPACSTAWQQVRRDQHALKHYHHKKINHSSRSINAIIPAPDKGHQPGCGAHTVNVRAIHQLQSHHRSPHSL